jgi:hypothetical protein
MTQIPQYYRLGFHPAVASLTHGSPRPIAATIAPDQTIAQGDALVRNASGLVEIADSSSETIYGFSAEPAVSDASGQRTDQQGAKQHGFRSRIRVYPAETITQPFQGVADDVDLTPGQQVGLVGESGQHRLSASPGTGVFQLLTPLSNCDPAAPRCPWLVRIAKPQSS